VELIQRVDDRPETIRKRFAVYREQTAPLIDYYGRSGRLLEVRGAGTMDEVFRSLRAGLAGAAGAR
jgi:adenylate kinase